MYSADEFYGDEITSPTSQPEMPASYYRSYEPNTINPLACKDEEPTMTASTTLNQLALDQATKSFTDEYVRSTPLETRAEEGLGIAIAQWAEWDGLKLMRVFFSALEDANFHGEAEQIQEMIDRLEAD